VKQAITDGRLWELVEARSRNHPALQRAFQRLLQYDHDLEKETPVRKKRGAFITTAESVHRPEVMRHQERLLSRYARPAHAETILLLPERYLKPFRERGVTNHMLTSLERRKILHICAYDLAFAIIPQELIDVFPLSQSVDALTPTTSTIQHASKRMIDYLITAGYRQCIIVVNEIWQKKIAQTIRARLRRKIRIRIVEEKDDDVLISAISKTLKSLDHRHRIS
jgi:7-cyano-7-deazaguanine tRNA-ribosyltransferase